MEIALFVVLVIILIFQFSQIRKHKAEIARLWEYGVHIENVLRANDLWVIVDENGQRKLGERLDSSLNAEGL